MNRTWFDFLGKSDLCSTSFSVKWYLPNFAVLLLDSVGASPKEQVQGLKSSPKSPLVHTLVHFSLHNIFCYLWICCYGSSFSLTTFLFFLPHRYIRIVGTHNTVNKIFHIVAFECMFTNKTFTLEKGLIGKYYNYICVYNLSSVFFLFH